MSHPAANIDDPGGQATPTLHDFHESDWSEFEVAELTWVKGQPRIVSSCSAWEKAYAAGAEAGTLQSLVDGATGTLFDCSHYVDVLDPWLTDQDCLPARLDRAIGGGHGTCEEQAAAMWAEECKVRIGVDAAAAGCKRRRNDCQLEQGATESGEGGDPVTRLATVSLGGNQAVLDGRDPHDLDAWRSFQDGRVQEANKEQASGMKDKSKKRNRIATAHNQSEKRRRAKFNQRMKTLQKLLPKSSKNDKVSILDDVISYTQKLQMQMQMQMQLMGNFIPCTSMMMPVMSQIQMQQLQMAMVAQYNMMARMSLSMGMNPLPNPSSVFPSFATRSNVTDLSSSTIAGLSWAGSSVLPNSADDDSIRL